MPWWGRVLLPATIILNTKGDSNDPNSLPPSWMLEEIPADSKSGKPALSPAIDPNTKQGRENFADSNPGVTDARSGLAPAAEQKKVIEVSVETNSLGAGKTPIVNSIENGSSSIGVDDKPKVRVKKEITPTQTLRRDQQKEFNKNSKFILDKNEVCPYCQSNSQQATDHIISVQRTQKAVENKQITREQALDFLPSEDNLLGSCTSCNSSKGGKPLALDKDNVKLGEFSAPNPTPEAIDKAAKAEDKLKGL